MADKTEEHRVQLAIIANAFAENPDTSEWPDEMKEMLTSHFQDMRAFLHEVEANKLTGTDKNEIRQMSLLKHLHLNKDGGKPNSAELNIALLLSRFAELLTLRVLLEIHNIPYKPTTIDEIAKSTVTVEDILASQRLRIGETTIDVSRYTKSLKLGGAPLNIDNTNTGWKLDSDNLPKIPEKIIKKVASASGLKNPESANKTVYKHRKQLYSLPEFQAFLRINSQH